uniref:Dynein regulatory complex protein 12 n=1 Tax=Sinocyclocheilus rhinocerous TaxID=307959 RepID=A0A673KNH1_9TELE
RLDRELCVCGLRKAKRAERKSQNSNESNRIDSEETRMNAHLNRQYKSVETDLQTKANRLEVSVDLLEMQLAECQVKLNSEREQREKTEAEKDAIISDLQSKLDSMERECEKILHGCLDSLLSHLAETQLQWEEQSTVLHQEVKDTLSDFGINPLHTVKNDREFNGKRL